jgi:hypothetical protein
VLDLNASFSEAAQGHNTVGTRTVVRMGKNMKVIAVVGRTGVYDRSGKLAPYDSRPPATSSRLMCMSGQSRLERQGADCKVVTTEERVARAVLEQDQAPGCDALRQTGGELPRVRSACLYKAMAAR